METYDDDLTVFAGSGAAPLPATDEQGYVQHDGACIWYATYGSGVPVILLHGGFGNAENWGYQLPALLEAGYQAVLIESRGHGRSTRDARPLSYELMASDILAVMDALKLEKAHVVGWSDGAIVALTLAMKYPARVLRVFSFGGSSEVAGVNEILDPPPVLRRIFGRHMRDYARLSATPDGFDEFAAAVDLMMKTQPNYSTQDLGQIRAPVAIVHAEREEFVRPEHAEYLARTIPAAEFVAMPGVSHFAPLQRPDQFNRAMIAYLTRATS
jgi:pimeloyl-ACP methyl ester carboxylesterase